MSCVFLVYIQGRVFLGSTAPLMGNVTPISRRPAKCTMRTACVYSGVLRAPLCIQGDVMAHFAGRREIGVNFPMRGASVDPRKHTTHAPDNSYCRLKDLMACVRKPREKLCASAFHPSKTRKTRTQSGWRSRPLLVPFFRGGMALARA